MAQSEMAFGGALVGPIRHTFASRWLAYLTTPVDGASLALFRICFGLIMLWEVWRYASKGWIARYYIEPTYFFSYLPFVRPWPGDGMYWHFGLLACLALCIALGYYYRLAAGLFFVAFTYVFLLDKTQYLNHFYLISLISLLLVVVPAHRCWSLDAALARNGPSDGQVPRWSLHILRAQIVIVYFFGGIAKLNPDWLRGEPMGGWLLGHADWPVVGSLLVLPVAGLVFAYGGLLIDLVLGFLLLWRRTFWLGAAIALVFHGLNANLFQIGIFPFFMIGALMLFPRPNWPRLLLRRTPHQPTANNHVAVLGRGTIVLLVLLHGYLVFQLAFPLRHWLYPGDVNWTEEGHRFSWRMMLREKDVDLQMVAIHPQTGQQWQIFPEDWLTSRQHRKMRARPDMIHQFAHYIADEYEQATGVRPQVKVRAWASLNGRPAHDLIDPNVDLAAQQAGLGPATWITATAPR